MSLSVCFCKTNTDSLTQQNRDSKNQGLPVSKDYIASRDFCLSLALKKMLLPALLGGLSGEPNIYPGVTRPSTHPPIEVMWSNNNKTLPFTTWEVSVETWGQRESKVSPPSSNIAVPLSSKDVVGSQVWSLDIHLNMVIAKKHLFLP